MKLSINPGTLMRIITVATLLGLAFTCCIQTYRLSVAKTATTRVTLAFDQYKLDQQAQMQSESERRMQAIEEIKNETEERIAHIQADADAAAVSAERLHQQLTELRLRANQSPSTAGHCPSTTDTIGVLTDVLARADQRAQALARIADERRAAGLACEQAYEALRQKP